MRPTLDQPPLPSFYKAGLALEDPDQNLNPSPDLRNGPINLFAGLIHLTALEGLAHDTSEGAAVLFIDCFLMRRKLAA